MTGIEATARATLFDDARTHNGWRSSEPLDEATIRALYDTLKWGPTSANCCPARFIFITSESGKEKLKPFLLGSNVDKTMAAPCTVIAAWDSRFEDEVPKLFPHMPEAKNWFVGEGHFEHGVRNASLQGAYLMLAARAMGLDCGPMSGFDQKGVDAAFFQDGRWKSNFLCNLGHGDPEKLYPRGPRLDFDEACRIA